MNVLLTCLGVLNDPKILMLATVICLVGVYGSFSVARHAGRRATVSRRKWGILSLLTAGCTAWATHMVALLAFRPGMQSGFEPIMTASSLLLAITGIGAGLILTLGRRERWRRFLGGVVIGLGVTVLHYVGQAAYVVRGHVYWDYGIVWSTILISLVLFGFATLASVERARAVSVIGAPLLVLAIGVLHIGGMVAMTLEFDPRVQLPSWTVSADILAPIVAVVSFGLVMIAVLGLRLTIAAKAKLRYERKRLGELANLALEGLAICDGTVIGTANDSLARLTGFSRDELVGRELASLLPDLDLSCLPEREEADAQLVLANGASLPVRVLRSDVELAGAVQTVVAFRDQSERLRVEERIRTLAYSDPLTGLANRISFQDALVSCVSEHEQRGSAFSLLLLDLDDFKDVNDAFGHAGGDKVLEAVATRARGVVGDAHLLARLGGDEFAVIVRGTADPIQVSRIGAELMEVIKAPIAIGNAVAHVSASVGVMPSKTESVSADNVTLAADLALYDAKKQGRDRLRLFTPELLKASRDRLSLAEDLRDAFDGNEFSLHYQPQVRMADERIVGAEALLRWNRPYLGVVSPVAFLSVLEAGPLAAPVGDWILTQACRDAMNLRRTGYPDLRIGVNLFTAQLRMRDFVERVEEALHVSGLPADALELEITENTVLSNEQRIAEHLGRLRKMSVGIAFDDFGTGFASLTMLKQLDITRLKIDRSFVRDIETDRKDQGIVDAIVKMAHGCDLEVIAEGIETRSQASYLLGRVTEGQGYLFGKPMLLSCFQAITGTQVMGSKAAGSA